MTGELAKQLEEIYIQSLEINLIEYLSIQLQINNREAMRIYYQSKLCQQIHEGRFGIQYLDYKYLAEDLIETEVKPMQK